MDTTTLRELASMLSRITKRFLRIIALNKGSYAFLGASLVAVLALYGIRQYLHQTPVTCDVAVVKALTGQPGDDQFVFECFNGDSRGPQSADDVAKVRTEKAKASKTFIKIGQFATQQSASASATGEVFAIYDGFPETVLTIFLDASGKIIAIQ